MNDDCDDCEHPEGYHLPSGCAFPLMGRLCDCREFRRPDAGGRERRHGRALAFAAILSIAGCATAPAMPAGMISGQGLPPHLYCFAAEHVDGTGRCLAYRSAQPTPEQFAVLHQRLGVSTVIKLNKPSLLVDGPFDRPPSSSSMAVWAHPWWPVGPVSHDEIQDAIADVDACVAQARAGLGACLVHCEHGVDRTGLLVAVWRVRKGAPAAAAWGEWRAFPRAAEDRLLYDAFERETGFHIPEGER